MLKYNKKLILFLIPISFLLFLVSCVDTDVQPIPSEFNFESEINVVNLAPNTLTVSVVSTHDNGADINYGEIMSGAESGSSFTKLPSGAKALLLNANDTLKFVADTDRKIRVFVVFDSTNGYDFIKSVLRYTWQTDKSDTVVYSSDYAQIAFVNGSSENQLDSLWCFGEISPDSTADSLYTSGFGYTDKIGYGKFAPGHYKFYAISGGDTLSTAESDFNALSKYTVAFYDENSTLKSEVYVDD